jgi:hypothetical protein
VQFKTSTTYSDPADFIFIVFSIVDNLVKMYFLEFKNYFLFAWGGVKGGKFFGGIFRFFVIFFPTFRPKKYSDIYFESAKNSLLDDIKVS